MGFFNRLFTRRKDRPKADSPSVPSARSTEGSGQLGVEDFFLEMFGGDKNVTGIQVICRGLGRKILQEGGTTDKMLAQVNEDETKALLLAFLDAEEASIDTDVNLHYLYNYVKRIRRSGSAVDQNAFAVMFKKWDNAEQP